MNKKPQVINNYMDLCIWLNKCNLQVGGKQYDDEKHSRFHDFDYLRWHKFRKHRPISTKKQYCTSLSSRCRDSAHDALMRRGTLSALVHVVAGLLLACAMVTIDLPKTGLNPLIFTIPLAVAYVNCQWLRSREQLRTKESYFEIS